MNKDDLEKLRIKLLKKMSPPRHDGLEIEDERRYNSGSKKEPYESIFSKIFKWVYVIPFMMCVHLITLLSIWFIPIFFIMMGVLFHGAVSIIGILAAIFFAPLSLKFSIWYFENPIDSIFK